MKRGKVLRRYKDPVCGMMISPSTAVSQWAFGGKIYYFCADVCCDAFKTQPDKFLHKLKNLSL